MFAYLGDLSTDAANWDPSDRSALSDEDLDAEWQQWLNNWDEMIPYYNNAGQADVAQRMTQLRAYYSDPANLETARNDAALSINMAQWWSEHPEAGQVQVFGGGSVGSTVPAAPTGSLMDWLNHLAAAPERIIRDLEDNTPPHDPAVDGPQLPDWLNAILAAAKRLMRDALGQAAATVGAMLIVGGLVLWFYLRGKR